MRLGPGSPQQARSLLSRTRRLPTRSRTKGPKVLWRKADSFQLEPEPGPTDVLSAEITCVDLGDNRWTAPKLNGFAILSLAASLCLFL